MKPKTVSVVDQDVADSSAVEKLLRTMGLEVAVYRSGIEFLDQFDLQRPGCVILEVQIPGLNGLRIQEELAARQAPQPVIFLTWHATISTAVRAVRDGAVHFLEKPFREQELWRAVGEALRLDERRRGILAAQKEIEARLASLTPEERRLAESVLAGKSNKQAAEEAGVCVRTIEARRHGMMKKLGAKDVGDLVQLFWTLGNGDGFFEPASPHPSVPRHLRGDRLPGPLRWFQWPARGA